MGERPILFSGEMVRGILAGRKTQTRRPVKPRPQDGQVVGPGPAGWVLTEHSEGVCRYGLPGDTLWVRETWRPVMYALQSVIEYAAGGPTKNAVGVFDHLKALKKIAIRLPKRSPEGDARHSEAWRPSIHMPRWASRLTLRVTDVRVERVQDISEEDAEREGCTSTVLAQGVAADEMETAREQFGRLWAELYGADSWDANPWVWVVGFEVVR